MKMAELDNKASTYGVDSIAKFLLRDRLEEFHLYQTAATPTLETHVFGPHRYSLVSQESIQRCAGAILTANCSANNNGIYK